MTCMICLITRIISIWETPDPSIKHADGCKAGLPPTPPSGRPETVSTISSDSQSPQTVRHAQHLTISPETSQRLNPKRRECILNLENSRRFYPHSPLETSTAIPGHLMTMAEMLLDFWDDLLIEAAQLVTGVAWKPYEPREYTKEQMETVLTQSMALCHYMVMVVQGADSVAHKWYWRGKLADAARELFRDTSENSSEHEKCLAYVTKMLKREGFEEEDYLSD
ncbi:hypothetical protein EDC01DRAFT_777649 [Geopyxis carbonaria]|nr:hypothetical protein EDC01DRAFT_777649 [Geopyxis carbonaria]